MYFIKYEPIKGKLRERSLTEREALPYLLVSFALMTIGTVVLSAFGANTWDYIYGFLATLTVIAGTLFVYRQNGGNQGYDFIEKYIVLGWIVGFRCLLVFLPVFVILMIGVFLIQGLPSDDSTGPFECFSQLALQVFVYQRLGHHIKDTHDNSGVGQIYDEEELDLLI
jgi:hypothetical protein